MKKANKTLNRARENYAGRNTLVMKEKGKHEANANGKQVKIKIWIIYKTKYIKININKNNSKLKTINKTLTRARGVT